MSKLAIHIESLLYVSSHALDVAKLRQLTEASAEDVDAALKELVERYRAHPGGIQLNHIGQSYQLSTAPEAAKVVQAFLEEEEKKELTKPGLETLTIIAYRGPITKAELELIRGVNCSLILRNLLIRGLVEAVSDGASMTTQYQVTFDFLHYLGIREAQELPDYMKLREDENLQKLLRELTGGSDEANAADANVPQTSTGDAEPSVTQP